MNANIDNINKKIHDPNARIRWSDERGWTSNLLIDLMNDGAKLLFKKNEVSLIMNNRKIAKGENRIKMLEDLAQAQIETMFY